MVIAAASSPRSPLEAGPTLAPETAQPGCRRHRRRPSHLPSMQLLPGLSGGSAAVVVALCGLLFAMICVNGQIDGYTAGEDYPAYDAVPKGLSFKCQGRLPGYYADLETRCQVWHWCLHSGHQYSFLCPNGTVFNQAVRVCDWWSNVNCPVSEQLYQNNEELYRTVEETSAADGGAAKGKQQKQQADI